MPARTSIFHTSVSTTRYPNFGVKIDSVTYTLTDLSPRSVSGSPLSSVSLTHMKSTGNTRRSLLASTAPISPKLKFDKTSEAETCTLEVWPSAPTVPDSPGNQRYGAMMKCQPSSLELAAFCDDGALGVWPSAVSSAGAAGSSANAGRQKIRLNNVAMRTAKRPL